MSIVVETFDTDGPADTAGLEAAIDRIGVRRALRFAVFVKVEGDYDDGSRERARAALEALIEQRGLADRTQLLTAVGCEGVSTPFGYVLAEVPDDAEVKTRAARLVMGCARSDVIDAASADRIETVDRVAETVRAAARDAGLRPTEVVMAFVKVPQVMVTGVTTDVVRGRRTRALAALGAGVGLEEIARDRVTEASVMTDLSLFCRRTQAFAGPEVTRVEVIVLGNRAGVGGALVAHAGLIADLIDSRSLRRMLTGAGLQLDSDGELAAPERIAAFFLKAGPSADGRVRGARTTIYGSSVTPEKHMRAAVSGMVGALLGTTRAFTTGDPIQQAPDGGGVACVIVRSE
ncbi:MAG: ring-opening amidohydrolase [Burkholderiales bacterium]